MATMTNKNNSKSGNKVRVRQLTASERAALDDEATACAAEIVDDDDAAGGPAGKARGAVGRLAGRVAGAVRRTRAWVRERLSPDNVDTALTTSKSYAKLAAKYGVDVAREAVLRRLRNAIERRIGGAVGGSAGPTGPVGSSGRGGVVLPPNA